MLRLRAGGPDLALETSKQLALELNTGCQELRVVLPDGRLLGAVCTLDPMVTMATLCSKHGRARES